MPPQQMPAPTGNPYEFIMGPGQPPKKSLLPKLGNSMLERLVIALVAGTVLIIVVVVLFSFILSSGNGNTAELVNLAARQTELARVADLASTKGSSPVVSNMAITTKLSLTTAQKQTVSLLKSQGHKVTVKELAAAKNPKNDQALTAASANNNFDQTFMDLMQTNLTSYQATVKKAGNDSSNKTVKQFLNDTYNGTELLLEAAKKPV